MPDKNNRRHKSCGVLLEHQGKFLIGRATGQAENFGIPKGKQEKGESDRETAVRELFEESNISLEVEDLKKDAMIKYTTKSGKKMVVFRVSLDEIPKDIKCNSIVKDRGYPEIDKFIWVDKKEALKLVKNHMKVIFETLR